MRHYLAVLALVAAGLCYGSQGPSVSAVEAPTFEIDDLGSVGGNFTLPSDINDVGDVVGAVQTATFDYHAFLYTDRTGLRDLGTMGGTGWSQAVGINNQGHFIGYFTRADGSTGAFLQGNNIGTTTLAGFPGSSLTTASGLNDADQVTGTSSLPVGAHAFVWSAATGMRDLGTLGGSVSNGWGINAHGQVVGQSIVVDDPYFPIYHAFRYTDGIGMQDLGALLPGTSRTPSGVRGINADGDVIGYSYNPGGPFGTFLYTDRDGMRDLGTLGGQSSSAYDINDNGAAVGTAALPSGLQHAFLYTHDAGMVDLNSLIDSTTGWTLWTAQAINNSGTIVGIATMGGRSRGYRARRLRDDSAPDIEALVSPAPNAAGWNTSDVTVRWRVRDPESGIASSSSCDGQTLTENTAGITLTCTAANPFGGTSSRSITLKIDKSTPEIGVAVSPQPNAAGWNSNDVTIVWAVRDPESGVVSSSGCSTQVLTSETAGLTLTCTAVNAAGGLSSRAVTVQIDKTPPVLMCAATPSVLWPPNGDMVPVAIAVTVEDALSGVATFALQSFTVDDPTAGPQAVTGFVAGTQSTKGLVQAIRTGTTAARVYTFRYTSTDAAGLTGSCTALVVVPHDVSR